MVKKIISFFVILIAFALGINAQSTSSRDEVGNVRSGSFGSQKVKVPFGFETTPPPTQVIEDFPTILVAKKDCTHS